MKSPLRCAHLASSCSFETIKMMFALGGLFVIVGILHLISACSIEHPSNGRVLPNSGEHNCDSTVTFTCNSGYSLIGSNSSSCKCCQWVPDPPTCRINICEDVTPANGSAQFINGSRFEGMFTANTRVLFICNDGYMLDPPTAHSGITNRCRPNGTWKKTPSTCIPVTYCESPTTSNGNFTPSLPNYRAGITVQLECDLGYKPVGNTSITCQKSRAWNPFVPSCTVVTCKDPKPKHGTLNVVRQTFVYNDEVEISCNEDYVLVLGASKVTCDATGNWHPKPGRCTRDSKFVAG